MKNILLAILCSTLVAYADLSVKQINNMVEKIQKKRDGVSLQILEKTKEPFIKLYTEENSTAVVIPKNKEVQLSLHAILNSKAFINEGWKSVGDKIKGYTLKYIGKRGVVLSNGKHIRKVFFHKKRENFIKVEGR